MNQEVLAIQESQTAMMGKLDALELSRKQDRQALDNVLFVCKQLSEKIQGMNQARQPGSFTPRHDPKGRSEWRSEIYELANKIVRLNGSTMKAVLKQGYDYLGRNYGWYFKDERRMFVERTGYKGDVSQISGLDIIESSEMYKSIFMSIMKDRLEIEKDNAAAKSGIVSALSKRRILRSFRLMQFRRDALLNLSLSLKPSVVWLNPKNQFRLLLNLRKRNTIRRASHCRLLNPSPKNVETRQLDTG